MLMEKRANGPWVQARSGPHYCPQCSGPVSRVHRRPVDRFFSQFIRVARYECERRQCHWVGNFRARNEVADSGYLSLGSDTRPSKAPRSFVVSMLLSIIGVALVVLAGTTDIFTGREVKLGEPSLATLQSAEKIVIEAPRK